MSHIRKTVYLCRSPRCKRQNAVIERIHDDGAIESPSAWQGACGFCGCGSLDMQFQKDLQPAIQADPFSTLGVKGRAPVVMG